MSRTSAAVIAAFSFLLGGVVSGGWHWWVVAAPALVVCVAIAVGVGLIWLHGRWMSG